MDPLWTAIEILSEILFLETVHSTKAQLSINKKQNFGKTWLNQLEGTKWSTNKKTTYVRRLIGAAVVYKDTQTNKELKKYFY